MADYPFLFLNHGTLLLESIGKCDGAYVGFVEDVPEDKMHPLLDECPEPIKGFASYTGNLLAIESPGDVFNYMVIECFGTPEEVAASQTANHPEVSQATVDRFHAAVETWAKAMHAMHPLRFIMGPARAEDSEWGTWSRQKFTETVVPFLEELSSRHPEVNEEDSYDDEDLESDDMNDTLIDEDISLVTLQPLRHGHVACLLQEFEPFHEIPVSDELRPRVDALLKQFPL